MVLPIPEIYPKLKELRTKTDIALNPNPFLRDKIEDEAGDISDFRLRHYQTIGVFHMMTMKRFILGDDTGLGKTIETIATLAYLWEKEPGFKVIIVAPKSALSQWQKEFCRFLKDFRGIRVGGTAPQRGKAYTTFFLSNKPENSAMVLNYHILARDWDIIADWMAKTPDCKVVTIFDEATAFKNPKTKTHEICRMLADKSFRVYGLTATLLKNNLMEGFGIFRVIVPGLFKNKTWFMNEFCHTQLQSIGGGRKIPLIVGYKNLNSFRDMIDPYFLGRPKQTVTDELPEVITKKMYVELTKIQQEKYDEALSGLLVLPNDVKETTKLTQMIYCQQIVDSTELLGIPGESAKEEELFRILEDELAGEKVVIYTNFRKMVDRLGHLFDKKKMLYTRITGAENKDSQREQNRTSFQRPDSGVNIIMITNAGSAAINLQTAKAIVFYDSPWSYGDYRQLLGRIVRIGSKHDSVLALHLVAEGSIDDHVLKILKKKKGIIDPILGDSDETLRFDTKSDVDSLFDALRQDAVTGRR